MKNCFLIVSFLFLSIISFSATNVFVGKGGKLDTFANGNIFRIKVSGIPAVMNDSFGFEYVNLKIKCAQTSDIGIFLYSPNGNGYQLLWRDGNGKNFDSTTFTDTGLTPATFGKPPFRGSYIPQSFLKYLNYNQIDTGTWLLVVYDYNAVRKDVLVNWSIGFGTNPLKDVKLDSSNLPILVINTMGNPVPPDDPMANSKLYVIENKLGKKNFLKDSLKYIGYCGIKQHGNWSRSFPKQSYSITTYDSKYAKSSVPLLGMPKENDWILLANFLDRSLMRNSLAQYLFSSMGHYTPKVKFAELVLNGRYQGVYAVAEKIKIDKNRLNIPKMDTITCNTGDSLTGGYLVKQDWKGNLGFYSKYAKPDYGSWTPYIRFVNPAIPSVKQAAYFKSFYDSFETALFNGKQTAKPSSNWKTFMDEKSFMDYFFIQEFSTNIDGYRASYYMWKNRNSIDKRIHLGPVWDFDIAFGSYNVSRFSWFFNCGYSNADFWWMKLLGNKYPVIPKFSTAWYNYGPGDTSFSNNVKCQWLKYRKSYGILNKKKLDAWVDSNAAILQDAQVRNFKQWPVWGWNTYLYEPAQPKNYKQEIDSLKDWLTDRLGFMDKFMPGVCNRDIDPPTVKLIYKDSVYLEVLNSYVDSGIIYNDNYGATNLTITKTTNLDTSKLGKYFFKYDLVDKAGNTASIQRTIFVVDRTKPIISFLNGDTILAEVNEIFRDTMVKISDNFDKSLTINIGGNFIFPNNIPTYLGYYTKKYEVIDQSKNVDSATLTIKVVDRKAPKISFKGKDTVLLAVYYPYNGNDVSITDNFDKYPTLKYGNNLKIIRTDKIGYYSFYYVGKDGSKNIDSVRRTLNIIDSVPPKVSLTGRDTIFLQTGDNYQDSGYMAKDNYDKNLKIDTIGSFKNTNGVGLFNIGYIAKDQSGNKSLPVNRLIIISKGVGIEALNKIKNSIYISNGKGTGIISVRLKSDKMMKGNISIFNSIGKQIYTEGKNFQEGDNDCLINVSNQASGVYLLHIQLMEGEISKQFILER